MAQIKWKQIADPKAGVASKSNKAMAASATAADFDAACATGVTGTPITGSYVGARVNGLDCDVGDAVKTTDCYFSSDAGSTALAQGSIASGAKLYWVGSVAGFELETTDMIDFVYMVAA